MKQKGMALILVLWVLSLLTIMAGGFVMSIRRETAIIAGLKNNAEAQATAESGLAIAELMLQNPDINKRWRADGSIYQIDTDNAKLRIRLLSETGKININYATPEQIKNLLNRATGNSPAKLPFGTVDLAAAIIDWRDADDLMQINGAEKQQYKDAGLNYQPRNKPFQSLEELQMVLGINPATLKWIEPLITVYTELPQIDIQLASQEVLTVLSTIDSALIDSYIAARVENARNNLPPPPPPLSAGLSAAAGEVTAFTIISEVRRSDESTAVLNVLVKKSIDGSQSTPYQVLRWQTSTPNNESLFSNKMGQLVVKRYAESEFNN
jgi:general secretion pathway protein K